MAANLFTKSDDYRYWRDNKLANAPTQLDDCIVEIKDPFKLSNTEKDKITDLCQKGNFALFQIQPVEQYNEAIISINTQFGLKNFDQHLFVKTGGLAYITQSNNKDQGEFIPYTDKNLGWHTDGYYNATDERIRAFSLFCVNPAAQGGINEWIDPQMIYLLLRDNNPDVAKALTHPQAMSIPEHKVDGKVRRATSIGPIFFIDEPTNELSMRYTQRKKNINFLDSTEIRQAVECLDALLNTTTDYHFKHLMQSGQGLLCNNVLHKRNAFTDNDHPRLLLRGRYFNRIE